MHFQRQMYLCIFFKNIHGLEFFLKFTNFKNQWEACVCVGGGGETFWRAVDSTPSSSSCMQGSNSSQPFRSLALGRPHTRPDIPAHTCIHTRTRAHKNMCEKPTVNEVRILRGIPHAYRFPTCYRPRSSSASWTRCTPHLHQRSPGDTLNTLIKFASSRQANPGGGRSRRRLKYQASSERKTKLYQKNIRVLCS